MELESNNGFVNDLIDFIDEQEVIELELDNVDENTFTIKNSDQANKFVKAIKDIRAERDQINAAAEEQLRKYQEKVEAWKERCLTPLQNKEDWFARLLEDFSHRQLDGSSKKSMKLIEGTLQFRKQQDKFDYEDEDLLAYLQIAHPEYIKHKPSVDKATLKKAGTVRDGALCIGDEVIPGVTVTPQDIKFEVK